MSRIQGMSWVEPGESKAPDVEAEPAGDELPVCNAWAIGGEPSWPYELRCDAGSHAVGTSHHDPVWGNWGARRG